MKKTSKSTRLRMLVRAYDSSYPCPPELFAGRDDLLRFYKTEVPIPKDPRISPAPPNVAFLGVWGVGKTSILRYIAESKEFEEEGFINLPIVKDFRGVDDLLAKALQSIKISASRIEWLKARLKPQDLKIPVISLRVEADKDTLTDHLIKTWSVLENAGIQHCSILIDDFHRLCDDDKLTLRNIFQHLPSEGCNYSLIVSGAPWTFLTELAEPVSRFFHHKKQLNPFTVDEIEDALRKPIELLGIDFDFNEEYVDELERLTLGHPYFIKFITLELAKKYTRVSGEHIKRHRKELLDALGGAKFKADFERASPGEQVVLIHLAKKKMAGNFEAREFKEIPSYTKYLERLCDKEVLNRESRGVYSVYHPLFLEWLQVFATHERAKLRI